MEFWARLVTVIDSNPVQEHDRFFMAMLKPLGIGEGRPFEPDARQQAILEEAAVLGDAMARNVMYEGSQRETGVTAFPGTRWDWVFYVKPSQETETCPQSARRAAAIHVRRDLPLARSRSDESRSRRELHPDLQGQRRQPLRRWQVVPPPRAREPAGGGLLVAHRLRQQHALDGPKHDERRGPRRVSMPHSLKKRWNMLPWTSTSDPQLRQARTATGLRRFPVGAST